MDEIISALGKTIAEMTYGSDAALRQQVLEDLTREIAKFEAEYAELAGLRHAALDHQITAMLIDSHCHLDFPDFAGDLDGVVARAQAAGIGAHRHDLDAGETARRAARHRRALSARLLLGRHPSAPRP